MASLSRTFPLAFRRQLPATLPARSQVRFATEDFGKGNPSADKEYSGPPPPKSAEDGYSAGSALQNGGRQKREYPTVSGARLPGSRSFGTSSRALREDRPKSVKGLRPRILSEDPPSEENQSEEVRKHNEEMKNRAERAAAGVETKDAYKDKAPKGKAVKGQWSGESGVDEGKNTEKKD